jgi:hypothetical protein
MVNGTGPKIETPTKAPILTFSASYTESPSPASSEGAKRTVHLWRIAPIKDSQGAVHDIAFFAACSRNLVKSAADLQVNCFPPPQELLERALTNVPMLSGAHEPPLRALLMMADITAGGAHYCPVCLGVWGQLRAFMKFGILQAFLKPRPISALIDAFQNQGPSERKIEVVS